MYFDIHVKENLDEFYNYRKELKDLSDAIEKEKLVIVAGLRRVGKTSLMRVVFNQYAGPKVFLDARDFRNPQDLFNKGFLEIYSEIDISKRIFDVVEAVDLGPFSIRLEKEKITLKEIDRKLQGTRAAVFIDEMQECPGLDKLIAHVYDYTDNVSIIVSGSEVGLFEELFQPNKPLFGRLHKVIRVDPLPKEKSMEFLRLGFAQEGKEYREEEIEETVGNLDGLIGWLTYYGYLRRMYKHDEAMSVLKKNAKLLLKGELDKFLERKRGDKERYIHILRGLRREMTWSEVKDYLEFKLKKEISNARVSDYLAQLIKHGFVVKTENRYRLADPLLKLL